MYDDGPDALRLRRLEGLKARGLIDPNVVPHKVVASTPEWDDMTPEERKMSSRAMEVYAGTVDRMDQEMGRVLDYLEESGEIDNTVSLLLFAVVRRLTSCRSSSLCPTMVLKAARMVSVIFGMCRHGQ